MTDDEHISDDLRQFETELRSLKPVRAADCVCGVRLSKTRRKHNAKHNVLFVAGSAMVVTVASLLIAWVALHSPVIDPMCDPVLPAPGMQVVETLPGKTPSDPMPEERRIAMRSCEGIRPLNVRQQTALMLEEMRLDEVSTPVPPRKSDYPVMVITVGQNTRPMSPEAKQALQRRLRGGMNPDAFCFDITRDRPGT